MEIFNIFFSFLLTQNFFFDGRARESGVESGKEIYGEKKEKKQKKNEKKKLVFLKV